MTLIFLVLLISIIKTLAQAPKIETQTIENITLSVDPNGGIITYTRSEYGVTTLLTPLRIIEKDLNGQAIEPGSEQTSHQVPSFQNITFTLTKSTSPIKVKDYDVLAHYITMNSSVKELSLQIYLITKGGKIQGQDVKVGSLYFSFFVNKWKFCNNDDKNLPEAVCKNYNNTVLDLDFDVKNTGSSFKKIDNRNFEMGFFKINFPNDYLFATESDNKQVPWKENWPKLDGEKYPQTLSFRIDNKIFEQFPTSQSRNFDISFFMNLDIPKDKLNIQSFEINDRLFEINPVGGIVKYQSKGEPFGERIELSPGNIYMTTNNTKTSLDINKALYDITKKAGTDYGYVISLKYFELHIEPTFKEVYDNIPIKFKNGKDLKINYIIKTKELCENQQIFCQETD